MSDYAIGDIQGCYDPLMRLLELIHFNEREDRLWFVGDLVNRGPQSLEVLRFIKNLTIPAKITLGNHDLHLLHQLFIGKENRPKDTLQSILSASDGEALGHWLRQQPLLIHDAALNIVMTHAGMNPNWTLQQAQSYAYEIEKILQGDEFCHYLQHLYGNEGTRIHSDLSRIERFRLIINYFTRMRFCDEEGHLLLDYKGTIEQAPANYIPWFNLPTRFSPEVNLIFGHWAALGQQNPQPNLYALDQGCVWGGKLTALHLQNKQIFSVPA